jgi:hypothetical protein
MGKAAKDIFISKAKAALYDLREELTKNKVTRNKQSIKFIGNFFSWCGNLATSTDTSNNAQKLTGQYNKLRENAIKYIETYYHSTNTSPRCSHHIGRQL